MKRTAIIFLIMWCVNIYSNNLISKQSIEKILYQVFNSQSLNIGKFYCIKGKLIRFPVYINSHFTLILFNGKSYEYDLKDFFHQDSDIIFFTNHNDLISKISKCKILYDYLNTDFKNYKELKEWLTKYKNNKLKATEIPIFTIEKINLVNANLLEVVIVNYSQHIFKFKFLKISGKWKLKKLSMKYRFSDVSNEKIIYY